LGRQIVTGSNIGGFYVFENVIWRTVREPTLGRSFQLYSSVSFHGPKIVIQQDGKPIATTTLTGSLADQLATVKILKDVKWGDGIYGHFRGTQIKGNINRK
jgi:hypothetical protein